MTSCMHTHLSLSSPCLYTIQKLPKSKACGLIHQYEVELSYDNGTSTVVTLPTDGQSDQLVCDGIKCYLNSSLKDVSAVSVTAYNSLGPTAPAYLASPVQGISCANCHQNKDDFVLVVVFTNILHLKVDLSLDVNL